MKINYENIVDTLKNDSKALFNFSVWLLALQILVPLPSIITIFFQEANFLLVWTLPISGAILCFYWWKKFEYFSQRELNFDDRRASVFYLGVSKDL